MSKDVIDLILTVVVIIFIFVGLPLVVKSINDYLDKKEEKMVLNKYGPGKWEDVPDWTSAKIQAKLREIENAKDEAYREAIQEYKNRCSRLNEEYKILQNALLNLKHDQKEKQHIELKDLAGRHKLSGVEYMCGTSYEGAFVKFCLDGVTYVAKENPDDGYRSYMEDLEITNTPCWNVFPEQDVFCDYESIEEDGRFSRKCITPADILAIKNLQTAKVILRIGTANIGDYYPECVMVYYPENLPCNSMKEDQS